MPTYFKPWRRKIGVMTQVIACVFAAAWVRSFVANDSIGFPVQKHTTVGLMSARGALIWCIQYHESIGSTWKLTKWTTRTDPVDVDGISWIGIVGRVHPCQRTSGVESVILVTPYWSFIVSLFLLSCYLLESNPKPLDWNLMKDVLIFIAALVLVIFLFSAPAVQ